MSFVFYAIYFILCIVYFGLLKFIANTILLHVFYETYLLS